MDTTNTLSIDLNAIARQFQLETRQVQVTVELLDEGNTVPFITRYRKDRTGGLDEEKIRLIQDAVGRWRQLNERKERALRSIQAQDKLNDALEQSILAATSIKALDDLYLPFRPKKQTLATLARQRGLEPLAEAVLSGECPAQELTSRAESLVDPQKDLHQVADVLTGLRHIIAEVMSERVGLRSMVRRGLWAGTLTCSRIETSEGDEAPLENEDRAPDDGLSSPFPPQRESAAPAIAQSESTESESTESESTESESTESESTEVTPVESTFIETTSADSSALGESESALTAAAADGEPEGGDAPRTDDRTAEPGADESGVGPSSPPPPDTLPDPTSSEATAAPSASEIKASAQAAIAARQAAAEERRRERREARHRKRHKLEQSFKDYFNYSEPLKKLPHYRILAINRGERCKVLRVKIQADQARLKNDAQEAVVPTDHPHANLLGEALSESLTRLVIPSIEREIRRELTDRAEAHAVRVFAQNLRKLLLQPPLCGHRVLAADPGFRSGCKLVALDEFGKVLADMLIHVIGPEDRVRQSRARLTELIKSQRISVVAIGNGTACRETEQLVAGVLGEELADSDVRYLIVNEAGASVYSTSQTGREELPRFDATVRGAVSIGRRALDPLSELVKIDPASIGVGLYQHDVKAKHLRSSLDAVVESCVNYVGVDLNSASPALLAYVSGMNQLTARRVYEHRQEHGPFRRREQLMDVPGIGEATFVQAAGFLKISDGDTPLDATSIHPESYETAERVLAQIQCDLAQLTSALRDPRREGSSTASPSRPESSTHEVAAADSSKDDSTVATVDAPQPTPAAKDTPVSELAQRLKNLDVSALAESLGVGLLSLKDILEALARPGRDPREDLLPPVFRREVLKLEDLKPGMELSGTVLNVVDFGAFVDIGLSDSGLIHVSRLADRFVSDPHEVVSVGDILNVWVVDVDEKRRRVSLTAIKPGSETTRPARKDRESGARRGAQKPHKPKRDAQPQGGGGRSSARRGGKPKRTQGAWQPRGKVKPKPVKPITEAMAEGNEPMRTFADLQQFFDQKRQKKRGGGSGGSVK